MFFSNMRIPRAVAVVCFALPWLAAVALFGNILLLRFPPSGTFVTTTVFDGNNAFILPFLPAERTTSPGVQDDGWTGQRIVGDPVYASGRIPGPYQTADVMVEYRSIRQPFVEFGLVRDQAGKDLDLRPMYAEQLEAPEWQEVDGGFVRNGTPPSRLRDPDTRGMAVWDAVSLMPSLSDPASSSTVTNVSLRGSHDLYLVPSGGMVDVTFTLQDVNRATGTSVVAIRLYRGNDLVQHEVIQTNASRETTMGKTFERRIMFRRATPGVYRLAFGASDDVFIRAIRTTSRRWVIGPRLNIGDVVGYATTTTPGTAWTTSRHFSFETRHAEGLQTVSVATDRLPVKQTHAVYHLDRTDTYAGIIQLVAPRGDMLIIGDGYFALRADAYFDPKPKRLTDATNLAAEHVVGVLTPYRHPRDLGDGWLASTFTFDLAPTQDMMRFVLASPGIADREAAVDIRRITITYRRAPLSWSEWADVLMQEMKNAWRRL